MRKFGPLNLYNYKPAIIAEAGVNHGGNLKLAKKYVLLAKQGNADAIKFQTYKADLIAAKNSPSYWDKKKEKTSSQYKLFKKYDKLNFKDYKKIKEDCKKNKIVFMTSLFDCENVDLYDKILNIFKISSSDINNVPLLKKIGNKKKPTIISTGASSLSDIKFALKYLNLNPKLVCIMHCVLNYPTKDKFANISYIKVLKKIFPKYLIGYSDHTLPDNNLSSIQLAYSYGAEIVEKHFTHNRNLKGNDHYHAMDKGQLINFNKIQKKFFLLSGDGKKRLSIEKKSIKYARRSIYAKKNIFKNEKLSPLNLITLRPATGISAKNWENIINKKSKKFIKKGSLLKTEDLKK
jgi:N-acetylneuraminate synthase